MPIFFRTTGRCVCSGALAVMAITLGACTPSDSKAAFEAGTVRPDVLPVIQNATLPFRYPPALYAEKVQGNVVLRLFVRTDGNVANDSTKIVESSNVALLDTAAVQGSRDLHFVPAKLHGAPVAVSILFPVYFRHPEAPPPAGDTVLRPLPMPSSDSLKRDTLKRDMLKRDTLKRTPGTR